jgi:hypothetical protein
MLQWPLGVITCLLVHPGPDVQPEPFPGFLNVFLQLDTFLDRFLVLLQVPQVTGELLELHNLPRGLVGRCHKQMVDHWCHLALLVQVGEADNLPFDDIRVCFQLLQEFFQSIENHHCFLRGSRASFFDGALFSF